MKKVMITMSIMLLIALCVYLLGAFACASLNISTWKEDVRYVVAFTMGFAPLCMLPPILLGIK